MNDIKKAILPTQDIVNSVSELMVERDLGDVSFDTLMSVVVEGAAVVEPSNFYEPYDTVSNALSGLDVEYDEVTLSMVKISEVEGLEGELCELAVKLARRLKRVGISDMGHPDHLPLVEMTGMTNTGDIIVDIQDIDDDTAEVLIDVETIAKKVWLEHTSNLPKED